jgi:hypothetical protein
LEVPASDICLPQVLRALENDGWQIVVQNEHYRIDKRSIFVDLRAERLENGSSETILLAEVKCFSEKESWTTDLYTAIGQYLVYVGLLRKLSVNIPLYLVIPEAIYNTVFDAVVRQIIKQHDIKMIIVNLETEAITQWLR